MRSDERPGVTYCVAGTYRQSENERMDEERKQQRHIPRREWVYVDSPHRLRGVRLGPEDRIIYVGTAYVRRDIPEIRRIARHLLVIRDGSRGDRR